MLSDVGIALHLLHVAILVSGGVGVWLLIRPALTHKRVLAELRRHAQDGTLADLAVQRALRTEQLPFAQPGRAVRVLHGYTLAATTVGVTAVAERVAGIHLVTVALAAVGAVGFGGASWYFARPRSTGHVLVASAALVLLTHAALVTTAAVAAGNGVGSRLLTTVLFCHPDGVTAPRVTLTGVPLGRPSEPTGSLAAIALVVVAWLVTAAVAGLCNRQHVRTAQLRAGQITAAQLGGDGIDGSVGCGPGVGTGGGGAPGSGTGDGMGPGVGVGVGVGSTGIGGTVAVTVSIT